MTTKVVNVKVAFIRPLGYKNLEEWMSDHNNVYIARQGIVFIDKVRYPKKSSMWANPFKIKKDLTREDVINQYEIYIRQKIEDENLYDELEKLRGKRLGCWCKSEACHGDVLLKLLEENSDENSEEETKEDENSEEETKEETEEN
jgi:hypothetical protein